MGRPFVLGIEPRHFQTTAMLYVNRARSGVRVAGILRPGVCFMYVSQTRYE
jgi:hypothetical protein